MIDFEMAGVVRSLRSNRPWLLRTSGRITAARVAAVIGYLLTMSLPDELNLLIRYMLAWSLAWRCSGC
jgi:hypothetical protein